MKQTIQVSLTVLATLLCGTAFAGPIKAPAYRGTTVPYRIDGSVGNAGSFFYNNFDATNTCGDGCTYDDGDGFFIFDPGNCFGSGAAQNIAWSFTAAKSGKALAITVAVTEDANICVGTSDTFVISLYADSCGPTGKALATGKVKAPSAPCGTAVLKFKKNKGPSLTAGTRYWVACESASASGDFTGVWWGTYDGDQGYSFTNPPPPYSVAPTGNPGAFSVQ
jgi:hypothetical protein